jgi:BTB/POZ domain
MACAVAPIQSINVSQHLEYISANQNRLAFAQFNEMRQHKYRIDVTLVVGRRRIDAHRIVLEAASIYFRSIFRSAMNESHRGLWLYTFLFHLFRILIDQIEMFDIDEDALSALIDFIYTSNIVINQDNVQSLLTVARYLLMTEIEVADMIIAYGFYLFYRSRAAISCNNNSMHPTVSVSARSPISMH